jgi:hypothetical protein
MLGLVIFFTMCLALLAGSETMAANNDISVCLNMAAKLEAGGHVSDDNLIAAHLACERAKEGASDGVTRMKLALASGAIDDEHRRRAASHY